MEASDPGGTSTLVENFVESQNASTSSTASSVQGPMKPLEVEAFVAEDVPATGTEVAGICGLYNIGNTCYMNSTLQCLLHNDSLKEYFLHNSEKSRFKDGTLLHELSTLFAKYWSAEWSTLVPRAFKKQIESIHSQFADCGQHDGQEFLALFLASLHQELKRTDVDNSNEECNTSVEDKNVKRKRASSHADDSMPNNKRIDSCCLSKQYLTITSLIGKEKKTANVNVLNTDVEFDEESTTDHSNKFPQATLQPSSDSYSENSLMNNQLFEEKKFPPDRQASFVKQIKDLRLLQLNGFSCKQTNVLADRKRQEKDCGDSTTTHCDGDFKTTSSSAVKHCNDEKPLCSSSLAPTDTCCSASAHPMESAIHCTGKGDELPYEIPSSAADTSFHVDDMDDGHLDQLPVRPTSPEPVDLNDDMQDTASNLRGDICGTSTSKTLSNQAEEMWNKYIELNKSVVVNTLQGQMESTVVCCKCSHTSTTYEPFMYLSVPIPHALQQSFTVSILPLVGEPSSHSMFVMKEGRVQDLLDALTTQAKHTQPAFNPYAYILCEVKNSRIFKVLEATSLLKSANTSTRCLKAIEFLSRVVDDGENQDAQSAWNSCCICLEDFADCELVAHNLDACSFLVCHACLQNTTEHYGLDNFSCPVCHAHCCPASDFQPLASSNQSRDVVVSVNFTYSRGNTVNFNAPTRLLRISTSLPRSQLYAAVIELIPDQWKNLDFDVAFCSLDGASCSRCDVTSTCSGCVTVTRGDGDVTMLPGDNIAIRFSNVPEQPHHLSTIADEVTVNAHSPVTLEMCINTFTQNEILDIGNPWFCPACQSHQIAEKKLRVCRWPETLIVYIKRFLYHSKSAVKVDDEVLFPNEDFDPGPISGTDADLSRIYDLSSCVSHFGGVYSGHYTSCCKHTDSGKWHSYNDENVSEHEPSTKDASSVYILFYKEKKHAACSR